MPLGLKTCPSFEPMLATVIRKLQAAAAAPDQIIKATGSASARANAVQRYLLRCARIVFVVVWCCGGVCNLIFGLLSLLEGGSEWVRDRASARDDFSFKG